MSTNSRPLQASAQDVRRWRRYLAQEHAEAAVYRDLATRRTGAERDILLALAEAEGRHAAHWRGLLGEGEQPEVEPRGTLMGWLARRFGSVFVLALVQRAEGRSAYGVDGDATAAMAADERVHEEVVRSLAAQGRAQMSGNFRAAVFGANDGLVSNLALILGIGASGVSNPVILFSGLAGLLAGALSMAAGEYVSVSSQRELADASTPAPEVHEALKDLDVNANELALVFRARGMETDEADAHAAKVLGDPLGGSARPGDRAADRADRVDRVERADRTDSAEAGHNGLHKDDEPDRELFGSAIGAAVSSFFLFASGAIVPVLPYLIGLQGTAAVVVSLVLVTAALSLTGGIVGVLSGTSPPKRALRQVAIGLGAAAATYALGLLFGGLVV